MININLSDIKTLNHEDFSLIEVNNNKYILKYKNNNIIIDCEDNFNFCKIYKQNDIYKIKINLNKKYNEKFIYNINILYNKICKLFENNDIFLSHIIRPIYGNDDNKILYATFIKNICIKNIANDEILNIDDILNNNINIYPILCSPILNLVDDNLYINLYFHSIFIKIHEKEKIIDYEKIKRYMINTN